MDTNKLISEIEAVGGMLLPSVARIIIGELDPTCDIEGAVKAAEGIATNTGALLTALRAKTPAITPVV